MTHRCTNPSLPCELHDHGSESKPELLPRLIGAGVLILAVLWILVAT